MKYLVSFILLLTTVSCFHHEVDIAVFEYDQLDTQLFSVEANLTTDFVYHRVCIKTVSDFEENKCIDVNNAKVFLEGDNKKHEFILEGDSIGTYTSTTMFAGKPGLEYKLIIEIDNIIYEATDSLIAPSAMNVAQFPEMRIYNVIKDYVYIHLDQHSFGYQFNNIWDITNNSRDKNISLNTVNPFSSNKIYSHQGTFLNGEYPIGALGLGQSGKKDDSITFFRFTPSKQYTLYLQGVFNETDWGAGVFATIKGNTTSNISNGATGYFACMYVDHFSYTFQELLDSLGLEPEM